MTARERARDFDRRKRAFLRGLAKLAKDYEMSVHGMSGVYLCHNETEGAYVESGTVFWTGRVQSRGTYVAADVCPTAADIRKV